MLICGTACCAITPKTPVALAGYAARWGKKSCGVHDDIFVKAFMFGNETERMLMLFADVEGMKSGLLEPVRRRIRTELGIDKVSFSATHTHSAPHTYPQVQLEREEMDETWVELLCEQLFRAAREATENTFAAAIGIGSILVPEIARNRRKGHTLTDPTLAVLRIDDLDGHVRGILLTYGCHCTVLDGNNFLVTSDFPGAIYQQMKTQYPMAVCAFSNGAAGDINIGYSSDASALGESMSIRTYENAERIGRILTQRATACMKEISMEQEIPIGMQQSQLFLPIRTDLPDETNVRKNMERIERQMADCQNEEEHRALKLQRIYEQCVLLRLHDIKKGSKTLPVTVAWVRLGKRLYLTVPGELFAEAGIMLKGRFRPEFDPVVLGYSNGYVGYLPSRAAMEEGGYEAETSIFAKNVADVLVEGLVAMKDSLV